MIETYPVVSTSIARAGYHEESRALRVEYMNGTIYEYQNVSHSWFEAFCFAESKGRFVIAIRKDPIAYPARRVSHRFRKPRSKEIESHCLDCGLAFEKVQPDVPCQDWPKQAEKPVEKDF